MSAVQFKKIDHIAKVSSDLAAQTNGDASVNGSLMKPSLSLFHRLPKITPNDGAQPKMDMNKINGQASDQLSTSSYEDGLRDGQEKASLVYLDTIKLLETSLQSLNDQYQLIRSEIESSHLKAIALMLKAILPPLAERSAVSQIQSLIKEICLESIRVSIRIHVNPAQIEHINTLVDSHKKQGKIVEIIPDPLVQMGSIRCDWEGGGVEIDTKTAAQQSLAILNLALADENTEKG